MFLIVKKYNAVFLVGAEMHWLLQSPLVVTSRHQVISTWDVTSSNHVYLIGLLKYEKCSIVLIVFTPTFTNKIDSIGQCNNTSLQVLRVLYICLEQF